MTDKEKLQALDKLFHKLLNKVNRVTAQHLHGGQVSSQNLNDLANRQMDVEAEYYKLRVYEL